MAEAARAGAGARVGVLLATVFGIGRLRPAPGTWASGAVALVVWGLARFGAPASPGALLIAAAVSAVIGVPAASAAARHFGRGDPSQVVIDEVLGQLIALACLPAAALADAPGAAACATFAAFRLFDIAKPWPVSSLESLPGGVGVMADDALAGLLAGLVVAAGMA